LGAKSRQRKLLFPLLFPFPFPFPLLMLMLLLLLLLREEEDEDGAGEFGCGAALDEDHPQSIGLGGDDAAAAVILCIPISPTAPV
jgi:hypothetical protein